MTGRTRRARLGAWAIAAMAHAILTSAGAARAQDFSFPAPVGPNNSALAFLERGLPPQATGLTADAAITRWYGLPELTTRALAVGVGWRSFRSSLGLSQTGDPELGWSAAGLALGAAQRSGGVALRAVARRDRAPQPEAPVAGRGVGLETGAGAWIQASKSLEIWAALPQLWLQGAPPPLRRPLEIGGRLETGGVTLWFTHAAPGRATASRGDHRAGMGLSSGPLRLWLEARDRPLRGGVGLGARVRGISTAVGIESHPILGETVRLALGLEAAGGPP